MTNGKFGKVQDFHQNGGLPLPLVQLHDVSDTYNYDISSYLRIAKNPLLRDPYEQQTTYIGPSGIHPEAGEGLFAKRALPKGTLIAIFNGVRKRDIEYGHNVTQLVHSPYKIALKRGVDLDIPDSAISARKYCATLAHKASHSFTPNSGFQRITWMTPSRHLWTAWLLNGISYGPLLLGGSKGPSNGPMGPPKRHFFF